MISIDLNLRKKKVAVVGVLIVVYSLFGCDVDFPHFHYHYLHRTLDWNRLMILNPLSDERNLNPDENVYCCSLKSFP